MEIVYAVDGKNESGSLVLTEKCIIDEFKRYNCLVGEGGAYEDNDWELTLSKDSFKKYGLEIDGWVYIPETEWAGQIKRIQSTEDGYVKVGGPNLRALVDRIIIAPKITVTDLIDNVDVSNFEAYLNYSGDANAVLNELVFYSPLIELDSLGNRLNSGYVESAYIDVDSAVVGVTLSVSLRFRKFVEALEKVLLDKGLRLHITHRYSDSDTRRHIFLSAKTIQDYSDEKYLSSDYEAVVTSDIDESTKRNYLIALGSGELEDRQIAVFIANYTTGSLYQILTGSESIIDIARYSDFNHNAVVYDYPSAESMDELIASAKEKFKADYLPTKAINFSIKNEDLEFHLYDVVGGEDSITGAKVTARIIQKELTLEGGQSKITYKVGDIQL